MRRGVPSNFLETASLWLKNLLDPNNPLMPYLLIFNLILLLAHIYVIFWVYRDAKLRFNRGAPWGLLAALFPVGGLLFYLLYRKSPLVQFDRIDAQYFDDQYEWTDYDEYRKNQSARVFQDLTSFWRGKEGSGYSAWIRASRARELKKKLTPKELKALRAEKLEQRKQRIEERRLRKSEQQELMLQRRKDKKERQTMRGAHGFSFRMSDSRQRKLRQKLELIEKLRELPREDRIIEDLIFDMEYAKALTTAEEGLSVAVEMKDKQRIVTYEHYIDKLTKLIERTSNNDAVSD